MSTLFSPLALRGVTIPNRIGMSPMCMYSATDGFATDWHMTHLVSRAHGGVGLINTEATAVTPVGRITPGDLGIWSDDHVFGLARIVNEIRAAGAIAGIQLAHAGRKGGRTIPWQGNAPIPTDEWGDLPAPSAVPFREDWNAPVEMDALSIDELINDFALATRRAVRAGFQVIEGHFAHGYLLHQFFSPFANFRQDNYGGSVAQRAKLLLEVATAMRAAMPDEYVLAIRVSAVDWIEGGITLDDTIQLARHFAEVGVDLIDVSSGAVVPGEVIPLEPGYQVDFAQRIRNSSGLATAAVGLIREPEHAASIIENEQADLVYLGRALLRDPYWARKAAEELGIENPIDLQRPYHRAVSRMHIKTQF